MIRAALLAAALLAAAPALAAPPEAFLNDATKGNNSEVAMGRFVASHGKSAATRRYGQMLVRDHSASQRQVEALARRMRVRLEGGVKPEAQDHMARLQSLRGPAFDREARRIAIADHQEDIAKYQDQARTGDRATASFARTTLPVLRRHLQAARAL